MPSTIRHVAALAAALAAAWLLAAPARAQDASADLAAVVQRWVDGALAQMQTDAMALRVEVDVGALDPRLRLAPCTQIEPYLPAGARLWGRTRLGLRCADAQVRWNVFLPLTVKAFGPAWVLADSVASGALLSEHDAVQAEVDWAAESSAIIATPQAWVGKLASRSLRAGQALRQSMVRAPELFKFGSSVRVVAQGAGYAVSASGKALGAGAAGQNVRIRMTNGKVLAGIVNEDGTIAVNF